MAPTHKITQIKNFQRKESRAQFENLKKLRAEIQDCYRRLGNTRSRHTAAYARAADKAVTELLEASLALGKAQKAVLDACDVACNDKEDGK